MSTFIVPSSWPCSTSSPSHSPGQRTPLRHQHRLPSGYKYVSRATLAKYLNISPSSGLSQQERATQVQDPHNHHANDGPSFPFNRSWPYPLPTSHLARCADKGEALPRRRNPRRAVAGKNHAANVSSSNRQLEELNSSNEEYVVRAALKCAKNKYTVSPPSHTATGTISKDGVLLDIVKININYDREEWRGYSEKPKDAPRKSPGYNKKHLRCKAQTMQNACVVSCDYEGNTRRMKAHYESCHMRVRPFKCTWCPQTFTQKSNGRPHLIGHTLERPWICYYCTDAFQDPSKRTRHIIDIHPEHCPGKEM